MTVDTESNNVKIESDEKDNELLSDVNGNVESTKKNIDNPEDKKQKPVNKNKKIGPQKQKEVLRSLLKRSKVYEVRNITRRIEKIRSLKANEEHRVKNERKVGRLLNEMEAIKETCVEKMAESLVSVFKGAEAEMFSTPLWQAATTTESVQEKLQQLSLLSDDEDTKYKQIAYLKLFASKDILKRLKDIQSGKNLKKPIKKEAKKKGKTAKKKTNLNNQSDKTESKPSAETSETKLDEDNSKTSNNAEVSNSTEKENKDEKENKPSKSVDKPSSSTKKQIPLVKENKKEIVSAVVASLKNTKIETSIIEVKVKKVKTKKVDSFFLSKTTDQNNDSSSDEDDGKEVFGEQVIIKTKRNRMGQRSRKRLQQGESGPSAKRPNSSARFNKRPNPSRFDKRPTSMNKRPAFKSPQLQARKPKSKPVEDVKSLHPSWQAKKKLNTKPVKFSGTRITFDD